MNRNILLVEPNYKNKYPPMSLMKLSTYYHRLEDNVQFFKGDLTNLVIDNIYNQLLKKLYVNNNTIYWEKYKPSIVKFIRLGREDDFSSIPLSNKDPIIHDLLKYYHTFYRKKRYFDQEFKVYDVICITTLFTFYWDITINTINFAKKLCKDVSGVKVGGIMASILPNKIQEATGIAPIVGPLIKPGMLDNNNDIIIDSLPLDYSILHEIDYKYPASDGYYAYLTRGCINHCSFCAVPILEPEYKGFIPLAQQINDAELHFGGKRDLLLLDNNVLASKEFDRVIDEIKASGFYKGATLPVQNFYEIAIRNLKRGYNEHAYIKEIVSLYKELLIKHRKNPQYQQIYNILNESLLLKDYTARKDTILSIHDFIKPFFEEMYSKQRPKVRHVDFNQGLDSRLVNEHNMQKLAEIPIRPVRIAFDHWNLHKIYERAIRIAVKCGHKHLSNYVLYNFEDHPVELYLRLRLNVELGEELGVDIYSFPMKYHPIADSNYFSNRNFIGKFWCRKFIRAIQAILNVTKGKVGHGASLFYKAFGKDEDEFCKILYMPEAMIIYRLHSEEIGLTDLWWKTFNALSEVQLAQAKQIIRSNNFHGYESQVKDPLILHLLSFYRIKKEDIMACNDKWTNR